MQSIAQSVKRLSNHGVRSMPQNASPLFRIPAEVRREIYRAFLTGYHFHVCYGSTGSVPIFVCSRNLSCKNICCWPQCGPYLKVTQVLGLTKTCRKAYLETIDLFYEENVFICDHLSDFEKFRKLHNRPKLLMENENPQIRHVQLRSVGSPLTDTHSFDGVQLLELDAWRVRGSWTENDVEFNAIRELIQLSGTEFRFHSRRSTAQKSLTKTESVDPSSQIEKQICDLLTELRNIVENSSEELGGERRMEVAQTALCRYTKLLDKLEDVNRDTEFDPSCRSG